MRKKRNRPSKYVLIARLAYRLTKQHVRFYTHPNSPKRYTQAQLVACVLMGFYLDLSYRDLEDFLLASDAICQVLELDEVPHSSTLCRACQRLRMPLLRQLNHLLLKLAQVEENALIVDATGMTSTRASRHYLSQTGRTMTDFIKAFYVIGQESQYILGWRYARGPGGLDARYLNSLRRQGKVYTPLIKGRYEYVLLADKGFDGRQALAHDLIVPRQGQARVRRPDRRARLDLTQQARLDGFLGQRWKIETVISVIKRKTGDTLRSKQDERQRREIALKALAYNLHRFVMLALYFTLNFATKQL